MNLQPLRHYHIAERFDNSDRAKGLKAIANICARRHKYATAQYDRYFERETMLSQHPFLEESDLESVEYVGEMGVSASIGAWIYKVALHYDAPRKFIIWYLPENEDQNFIYLEFQARFESIICGGMTDFSGEGGAAYNEALSVAYLLAEAYQISIEKYFIRRSDEEGLRNMLTEAIYE